MKEYHKIQTIWKRDAKTKRIMAGEWALPEFEFLAGNVWEFTEKVDGTNIRVHWDGESVRFGGRTESAQIPAALVEYLNKTFARDKFSAIGEITLYGEGYGPKIQKVGELYREDQAFVLFDACADGWWWLKREDVDALARHLQIDSVPVIGSGSLLDAAQIVRDGLRSRWGDFDAEGIVARPKVELKTRGGDRIIAKIKHRDFV